MHMPEQQDGEATQGHDVVSGGGAGGALEELGTVAVTVHKPLPEMPAVLGSCGAQTSSGVNSLWPIAHGSVLACKLTYSQQLMTACGSVLHGLGVIRGNTSMAIA
jgi:hypothetical protein